MKVNPVTQQALQQAADTLRIQNKEADVKRLEEHLKDEKMRLSRLKRPSDGDKGINVDTLA